MARRKSDGKRRLISKTEWASFAEEIKHELSTVNYGHRLARYRQIAAAHDLNFNVIRRVLRALSALEEVSQIDEDLAQRLRRAPLVVSEVTARWLRHDQAAAIAAANSYLAGQIKSLSLTQAEVNARPVTDAPADLNREPPIIPPLEL